MKKRSNYRNFPKSVSTSTAILLTSLTVSIAGALVTAQASAQDEKVTSPLFTCNMSFHAHGKSVYLGLGYTEVKGEGEITCLDFITGATQVLPVKVKARGPGVGLGVTGLALSGGAVGVGVAKGPDALLGHYLAIRGNAAAGIGAAAQTDLRLSNGAATIDVSVQGETGVGAGIDLLWIDIERNGDVKNLPPSAPALETIPAKSEPDPSSNHVENRKVIYVNSGEAVDIVDSKGKVLTTLELNKR